MEVLTCHTIIPVNILTHPSYLWWETLACCLWIIKGLSWAHTHTQPSPPTCNPGNPVRLTQRESGAFRERERKEGCREIERGRETERKRKRVLETEWWKDSTAKPRGRCMVRLQQEGMLKMCVRTEQWPGTCRKHEKKKTYPSDPPETHTPSIIHTTPH